MIDMLLFEEQIKNTNPLSRMDVSKLAHKKTFLGTRIRPGDIVLWVMLVTDVEDVPESDDEDDEIDIEIPTFEGLGADGPIVRHPNPRGMINICLEKTTLVEMKSIKQDYHLYTKTRIPTIISGDLASKNNIQTK